MAATPGERLWTSALRDDGCCPVEVASPDGTRLFVSGYVKTHFETVAYNAATGAQLWAKAYQAASFSNPTAITVSPDGARVYVTGRALGALDGEATIAYDAGTGKLLWASGFKSINYPGALAVSPDGTALYVASSGPVSSRHPTLAVIAYAAATGRQRWLRYYTKAGPGHAASVAVSPDGKTVYATGAAGSSALTVAYQANGTLKWAARYKSPYPGYAGSSQVVAGPGGNAVYVAATEPDAAGHVDIATFAYRAATGQRIWLDSLEAGRPEIAVTPDGQKVIVTGPSPSGNAIASYNASTGRTQWTTRALNGSSPSGLVISPHGDTVIVGGGLIGAYSVADGTVLWTTRYAYTLPTAIALSSDGTRLFATGWDDRGITTVAYQT